MLSLMKYILGALGIITGLFFFKPSLFQGLPIPMTESYRTAQTQKAAQRYEQGDLVRLKSNWKRPAEITEAQLKSLVQHPKFRESYCQCEAEILNYAGLIPSNFFPKGYREQTLRGIASHLEKHAQTQEGKEQIDYCFFHGWNRAAYSLD